MISPVQFLPPGPMPSAARSAADREKGDPEDNARTPTVGRLLIVSNRLPVSICRQDDSTWSMKASAGGLATGLHAYLDHRSSTQPESIWIGWPGTAVEPRQQPAVQRQLAEAQGAHPVFLDEPTADAFYNGFCNDTLWPLFHYFTVYTTFSPANWDAYVRANHVFCEEVAAAYEPGDVIWIHDYHLMLLPRLLRERLPDAKIGFFLHIPFPSFEIFRLLPREWSRAIVDGLLGSDLIGFHTHDYSQHFLRSVLRIAGLEHQGGHIEAGARTVRVETFPMGIEVERFARAAVSPCGLEEWENLSDILAGRKAILSVDRLDYTKGIQNRLEAFELFLEQHPEWHAKVVLVAVVVPSRETVAAYDQMKQKIDQTVGAINGRFGDVGWTPVIYQYRQLSLEPLAAAYAACDVALVTPLRDGMNLVAKEYVASCVDDTGVLVLSEMAGAATELGEAILVNPHNRQEVADAIQTALEMPPDEQRRRLRIMRERLHSYDVVRWADDFLTTLHRSWQAQRSYEEVLVNGELRNQILDRCAQAERRLILTDYDGTLVGFHRNPLDARPSARVLTVLRQLAQRPGTDVALVSGRVPETLEEWFGDLGIALAAEHGAYVREPEAAASGWTTGSSLVPAPSGWRQLGVIGTEWKEEVRPILQLAASRLPGAFVEEKHLSVGWHWRAAEPELGRQRAMDLVDQLHDLLAHRTEVQVLQGNKVIEVRSGNVNKGIAGLHFIGRRPVDFILAVGDDWTDEDLFKAMPESACTIKVGLARSAARYAVRSPAEVLELLEAMAVSIRG